MTPPRATSSWDRRWRWRWCGAALLDSGWAVTGWRQDLDDAVAMARNSDPATHALVVFWKYGWTITNGVLLADDTAVRELEEALQIAERSGDDTALGLASTCWVSRWEPGTTARTVSADWSCWRRSATCACTSGSTGANCRASNFSTRWRGPGCGDLRWCHTGDSESRRRFLRARPAGVRRCRHRLPGGGAAGPWHRG